MNFNTPDLAAAHAHGLAGTEVAPLAKAQNLLWEECVSAGRLSFFENEDFYGRGEDWQDLVDRHDEYIQLYVNCVDTPHTFDTSLAPASLVNLDEDQLVVRLENLGHALANTIFSYDEVLAAHEARDMAALNRFTEDWNAVRDARPAFATFMREVQDEIDSPEWALLLRDRLGLAHFRPGATAIPVALMAYPVRQVGAEAGPASAFTTPTVLDARLWEHYFPAPKEIAFGRAMALTPCERDNALVAEILHSRLSYRGVHIIKMGQIMAPLPTMSIAALRENHLLALQIASGRDDFGA